MGAGGQGEGLDNESGVKGRGWTQGLGSGQGWTLGLGSGEGVDAGSGVQKGAGHWVWGQWSGWTQGLGSGEGLDTGSGVRTGDRRSRTGPADLCGVPVPAGSAPGILGPRSGTSRRLRCHLPGLEGTAGDIVGHRGHPRGHPRGHRGHPRGHRGGHRGHLWESRSGGDREGRGSVGMSPVPCHLRHPNPPPHQLLMF